MSALLMGRVFYLPDLTPSEKLLLLALADNADDDGENCFPKLETLETKTGHGRRSVQKLMKALEGKGYVRRELNAFVGTKGQIPAGLRPNLYTLVIPDTTSKGVNHSAPQLSTGGEPQFTPGANGGAPQGRTPVHPEPSVEPSVEPPSPPTPHARPERAPHRARGGKAKEAAREIAGMFEGDATATGDAVDITAEAMANGWTLDDLKALARDAKSNTSARSPHAFYVGMLRKRAGAPPAAEPTARWSDDWAVVSRCASRGLHDWTCPIDGLSERGRLAAMNARMAIRYQDATTAKLAYKAEWETAA